MDLMHRIGTLALLLPIAIGCSAPAGEPSEVSMSLAKADLESDLATIIPPLLENPDVMDRVASGGAFGGTFSRHVAQNMFGRNHQEAIDDAKRLTQIEEVADVSDGPKWFQFVRRVSR